MKFEHNKIICEDSEDEIVIRLKKDLMVFAFENAPFNFNHDNGNSIYTVKNRELFYKSFMKKILHHRYGHDEDESILNFLDNIMEEISEEYYQDSGLEEVE